MNRILSPRSLTPSGARTTRRPRSVAARLASLAATVAALVAWSSPPAGAVTYFVDRNNPACSNTGAGAGSATQPYCTISAAVAARAAAGNTILVSPGTYPDQVTINASGVSGSPIVLQATATGVVVDGADDFTATSKWALVSGNVWLASTVTWNPKQLFLDGTRADSSTAAVTSLPSRTYRFVPGIGLYVNAGGGNPGTHQARVGRRNYGFSLFGRSFITIDGFNVTRTEDRGIYINGACTNVTAIRNIVTFATKMGIQVSGGSANVISANSVHDNFDHGIALINGATGCTIEDNDCYSNARPADRLANGIYLFGCPTNTIRRNRAHNNDDTGIHIQSGSNNCILYLNRSYANGDHGYDHLGCTGSIHVCDVAHGNFKDGFSIEGNATGTQLHDCIATDNGLTTNEFNLWVDQASSVGFVSDYNIFWNSTTQAPIKYIVFTPYATIAAYSAVSGQDTHSIQADPRFVNPAAGDFHLRSGSPAIDNADSGTPNYPSTDADGQTRRNDQGTPNTGVGPINYGERGAYEFRSNTINQPPVARLTVTPTSGFVPLPVLADGSSSTDDGSIATYRFDFGDGTIVGPQAGATASHTYNTGGSRTVTLTVTDNGGLTNSTTATVSATVDQAPNGVIGTPAGPVTIAAGQSVNFTGSGTDPDNNLPLTYAWNFGGGATNSTLQNPGNVVFATAGTYTVAFTVTDALGLADPTPDTRVITVTGATNQAPNGVIGTPAGPVTINAGQSVNFTGSGTDPNNNLPLTYAWNFGGGAANSTLQNPGNVVFATAGTYTVTFTVTDALGLADPTPDTRVITVTGTTTNQAPNGVIGTPAGPVTITAGQAVTFTGTGTDPNNNLPLTYSWNFGGGAANSTLQNPGAVAFTTAGTYTVSFTVTDALGLADPTPDTRVITVNPVSSGGCTNLLPNPSFETDVNGWKGVGGTIAQAAGGAAGSFCCRVSGGASTSSFYLEDSPRTVTNATAGAGYHCAAQVRSDAAHGSARIRVMEYLNGTKVGQLDSPAVTLSTSWQKVEVDYTPVQTGSVLYFTVKDAPVAPSEVFDVDDCTLCALGGTPTNQAPNGTITAPPGNVAITAGQSVNFAGNGADPDNNLPLTYLWNFGGGATNSTLQNPGNVVFAAAGTYTVTFTVTDALGAADPTPDSRVVIVTGPTNQAPNGVIGAPAGPVTINVGQSVNFTGSGTDPDNNLPLTYAWNFGGGAANSTLQNPGNVAFATAGTYTVTFTVTDALGLADPTPDTRVITVNGTTTNQAPNGVIGTPAGPVTISAGQGVSFTGTGTDPDNNTPLTYAWNFGGGAANSTVQSPGMVVFATAGTYTVAFTVTDALGLADPTPDTRVITVNPATSGGCTANLIANPSFETNVTGWKGVGATIAQVAGGSVGSFSCRVTGAASTSSFYVEDSPRTILSTTAGAGYRFAASVRSDSARGSCRIRIMEYLNGIRVGQLDSPPVTLSPSWQRLEVSYTPVQTGSVLYFTVKNSPVAVSEAFDVDDCSACPLAGPTASVAQETALADRDVLLAAGERIRPFVAPNPMTGASVLKFSTRRPGPLHVALFDLSGRRVQTLVDDPQSPAGLHVLPLSDRGDNGARLESGIYFYRIRSADGRDQGRFLIMN